MVRIARLRMAKANLGLPNADVVGVNNGEVVKYQIASYAEVRQRYPSIQGVVENLKIDNVGAGSGDAEIAIVRPYPVKLLNVSENKFYDIARGAATLGYGQIVYIEIVGINKGARVNGAICKVKRAGKVVNVSEVRRLTLRTSRARFTLGANNGP
jgi:hypothetical protein